MISLIAAVGENLELGKNNELIWHLKGDMAYFRKTTLNHKVIMGYNTYKSIGKALPQRKNIVLTHNPINDENITVYNDIEELINKELNTAEECFIIGGASLYKLFITRADKLYLTLIKDSCKDADVYFPQFEEKDWYKNVIEENEENGLKYEFVILERIKK